MVGRVLGEDRSLLRLTSARAEPGTGPLTAVAYKGPAFEAFEALVEHSSDVIVVVDTEGIVRYANPATIKLFGPGVVGDSVFTHMHPPDRAATQSLFQRHKLDYDSMETSKLRFEGLDGRTHVLEITTTNRLHDETVRGIIVNGRDVTERDSFVRDLEVSLDAFAGSIAYAVELRDPYTAGHERQVADIAQAIAVELQVPEEEVRGIVVASTIHDIGKIAVPAEILNRPGKLTAAEFEIIKAHAQAGHDIIAAVPFPWPVAEMILQHHERLDGSGYPRGLAGDAILPGTLILSVADVVSAMSSHRPFRPALGRDAALAELEANRGRLYGPDAVDACLRLYRERQLPLPNSDPLPGRGADQSSS